MWGEGIQIGQFHTCLMGVEGWLSGIAGSLLLSLLLYMYNISEIKREGEN
jgi:hypothetical protein